MTPLLPTPVKLLERLSTARTSLWVKDDGVTSTVYGGNKARKIGRLLEHALERGADTLVTVGAVGSHHVLTTGLFGRPLGFRVEAVVVAQPHSAHAQEMLLADVAAGIELFPASSAAHAAALVAWRVLRGASFIPAGGSNPLGARAFVDAAEELAQQVRDGELPPPDLVVVPMGSGGTAAGLVAGFANSGLRTRVLAVTVAEPAWLVEQRVRSLAEACTHPAHRASALQRLEQTRAYLGGGYGHATPHGDRATRIAESVGLTLDPTYTAKAFAAALDRVSLGRERTILYWHTLSRAPMARLLAGAPSENEVDPRLLRLLLPRL